MKHKRLNSVILIALLMVGTAMASACSSETKNETTVQSTSATTTTVQTSTEATTTTMAIAQISGTIAGNSTPKSWKETPIEPAKTMYVKLESDFLKVRTGPGTQYEQISALTDGMAVSVVAKTESNWYKLSDGYFVFGDYLTDTKS
jgi:hypothetical protein